MKLCRACGSVLEHVSVVFALLCYADVMLCLVVVEVVWSWVVI